MATRTAANSRYLELVAAFPLRPIRTEVDLDRAIATVNGLLDLPKRTRDEEDYLEVLGTLVEQYEEAHYPMGNVTGAAMLAHLIEARALTQAKVSEGSGIGGSTLSEILAGKRKLNTRHIAALARFFEVDPGLLIDV